MFAMMQDHMWATSCVEGTKQMAKALAPFVKAGDCVELSGDLGAGKTQFVQGLAAGLGISAQVISPTFNILLSYPDGRIPLFHFDLYRLDEALELEDIGFYDVLEDEGVVCIEWGDKFPEALPDDRLIVCLRSKSALDDADARIIDIDAVGRRSYELRGLWEESLAKEAVRFQGLG
ncbi:MAG: tRNA (adenosine(37)-N6)-threonylcarbamoyltransferase complex ATPase subunit type 1 TsaE [Eggerthellaceae bacterium]|nr:tRNA (adenosine(37)-N6)-threonylcarbamoyltransferase complex ATPase subunit type 1 TsaE [Eggerthellaceae bacterium]